MLAPSSAGFRRLLPLLKPHRPALIAGGACMLVFVVCWPLLAWLAGQLIPAIGAGDFNRVLQVIGLALTVFMLQKIAQFGQDTLLAGPALQVSQELRRRLFARLQRLDFGVLEKLSAGDLTYRLTEDADRVGEVIYKTIQDTTPSVLQLVVVFGYMVWLDWKLSIGTLLLAPLVAVLVSVFGAKVMGAAEKSQKQVSELASLLGEAISGLPLVRAFAAEPWLQQRFEVEIDLHRKARYRTQKLLALQYPVVGFLEAAGILAVLLMGAARIQSGDLDGQGFSSYVAALLMLIDPISHLTTNFNEFQQGQASLKRLREIEREAVEQPDRPDAQPLGRVAGELLLEQVSFGYDPQQPVLKNLSLQVKPGQVVALVGPSGAGKSTLFSLLLRFNTAQGGQVLLDGRNLADLKAAELRTAVALVPLAGRPPGSRSKRPHASPMPTVSSRPFPAATTPASKSGAATSPAANCNGWPLPGRCSATRRCCCWMRPPAPWMPRQKKPCRGASIRPCRAARFW
jgi:ATP-binding cassette subfamily B protein